ncbi:MAG: carbamoyl-phosphate synthase large subunit [Bacteriovoracaceae bacterium]|jgi:carbamoyl-phosphate synthase large subunit|nr:carbamoyl-phosphate synthase large subunit [Bacteriovoracaceae bacterium]
MEIRKRRAKDCFIHFKSGAMFKASALTHSKIEDPIGSILWGESAFTTSMSGYQETLTDPSYLGQHIIFAYPHIGNYAPCDQAMQASRSFATCAVARNFSPNDFLDSLDIPLITDLDTRSLIKYLTHEKKGVLSAISYDSKTPSAAQFDTATLRCNGLLEVSIDKPIVHKKGANPIVVMDYGIKKSILFELLGLGIPLVQLPYNASYEDIMSFDPRMVFLSNGPGDPAHYQDQVAVVSQVLKTKIPIRAICLGHQLTGLALGATSYQLPFGHRGTNHPVKNHTSGEILITSQNHGHALDPESLKNALKKNATGEEFILSHSSLFDSSVEGICSANGMIKTVQFHPEANPGPRDAHVFFEEIDSYLKASAPIETITVKKPEKEMGKSKTIPYQKVLLIGSGPIKIGQASEFDYSGTQALKSLQEIGVKVVLINSNPATIMTDKSLAHKTYIEPITIPTIKSIIEKENVDAIISTMGGQTALNTCVELEDTGYLKEKGVVLLGSNSNTIEITEDREKFTEVLNELGYKTGTRVKAYDKEEAIKICENELSYPCIIRRDFALGGHGSAIIRNVAELCEIFTTDLKFPITLEKSLIGYKEVELEVMVDYKKNGVIICSIENIDPCGVHTGDSITVAPVQTISDHCYQQLRTISLTIAKRVGVKAGGANVQFAINPLDEDDIIVIEMNPRVSRSSALASKATGYPIAKISALLAVGYTLPEILNDITKASPVCFEPTLDYVAVKIPIFPFSKFPQTDQFLGPQMRSVGEVLGIGSNFNEAFLKALRSLEMDLDVPELSRIKYLPSEFTKESTMARLGKSCELSLLTVLESLRQGGQKAEIFKACQITPWFIDQMEIIKELEDKIKNCKASILSDSDLVYRAKQLGFSDKYLARISQHSEREVFEFRQKQGIHPVYKAVDTCSAEFIAKTPYYYSTYQSENEAVPFNQLGKRSVAILGSGPNRIGQGIEFDYSCVKASLTCQEMDYRSILINSNPETVSTDYDSSDRLYLSPIHREDVEEILRHENPEGIITCFSGQSGITIRSNLEHDQYTSKYQFLGVPKEILDLTEDREQFDLVLDEFDISKTKTLSIKGPEKLKAAMKEIGLPVMVRPSFVIGGESMFIFHHYEEVDDMNPLVRDSLEKENATLMVENYLEGATEYDVDLVRDKFGNTQFTICEHIEYAGVHSGDSGMVTPPILLTERLLGKVKKLSVAIAEKLGVVGPLNIQFAIMDQKIFCIEANPRGSRTLPFLSKAFDIDLPRMATKALLGETINPKVIDHNGYFCVKQSTFPFDRFPQDDIILGPKMRSTGETMGIDYDKDTAILKSYLGNYPNLVKKKKILMSLNDANKPIVLPYLKGLIKADYELYATYATEKFISRLGIPCTRVAKVTEKTGLNLLDLIKDPELCMVFNTPYNKGRVKSDGEKIRNASIQYAVPCFTRAENIKSVMEALLLSGNTHPEPVSLQELTN